MEERLSAFDTPLALDVDEDAADRAWCRVEALLERDVGKVDILAPSEAYDVLPSDTSAGFPYSRMGYRNKGEARPIVLKHLRKLWVRLSQDSWRNIDVEPVLMSARSVVRLRGTNKPRPVWAYPARLVALEAQFGVPITRKLKEAPWMGWRIKWLGYGRWREQLRPPTGAHGIVSCDFDSFDARVASRWIRRAFEALSQLHDLSDPVDRNAWNLIVEYFVHTPYACFGEIRQKHRGVPSGTYFTQIIGTLVNMFYTFYVDEVQDGHFKMVPGGHWLGDDSRFYLGAYHSGDTFSEYWLSRYTDLGCVVNPSKCSYVMVKQYDIDELPPNFGSFLSRKIWGGYPHITFDDEKFLGQILIPEDRDRGPEHALTRLCGLAWAYGYQSSAYRVLEACRNHLLQQYPDVRPVSMPRLERYLGYQLGLAEPFTITGFPPFAIVRGRTLGYV
jgi:hypothetical protein